jgi:lysozyme family protein
MSELYNVYRDGKYLGSAYLELPAKMVEPLLELDVSDLNKLLHIINHMTEQQEQMGLAIVREFEGRYKEGKLTVYKLPSEDGGGTFEVAGVNDKYHSAKAHELRELINIGEHTEAELEAARHIVSYTEPVRKFFPNMQLADANPNIEFLLRDCGFNRGLKGAATILQIAIGMMGEDIDGVIGSESKEAFALWLKKPLDLALMITDARDEYERTSYPWKKTKRNESSSMWEGLVNRWQKAHIVSGRFV